MNYIKIPFLILVALLGSCNYSRTEEIKNDKKMQWFNNGEWRTELKITPDETVNVERFYEHYHQNQELWEMAFNFLNQQSLTEIEPGRYDLKGDSLFVVVQEYVTKNEDETQFESHRKYIDLQYLISGEEKIGVMNLDDKNPSASYDEEKDISFYKVSNSKYRLAHPGVFFIFFPEDAHRPCVKADQNNKVKKVVIKIISES